ncbi:hypothetical protein ZWY2020_041287 [Hordeum vulgare]|nr:hypothetical protein ZWY2020_041287 [Hordeum vulgare]
MKSRRIQPDSEYPDWLWHLVDKRPMLSNLRMKDAKILPYEDLSISSSWTTGRGSRKRMLSLLRTDLENLISCSS